jgi:hypothetical protein
MDRLEYTIREALENAPPEHLQLALTALIEARFTVWPKEARGRCERLPNPLSPKTLDTFEWWTDWSGQVSGEDTPSSHHSSNN